MNRKIIDINLTDQRRVITYKISIWVERFFLCMSQSNYLAQSMSHFFYWVAQESAQQEFLFFKYVPKTEFPRNAATGIAHITETTQIGNMSSVLSRVTFGAKAGWQSVI